MQWNWYSVVTGCTWFTCISDVREPISLHQTVDQCPLATHRCGIAHQTNSSEELSFRIYWMFDKWARLRTQRDLDNIGTNHSLCMCFDSHLLVENSINSVIIRADSKILSENLCELWTVLQWKWSTVITLGFGPSRGKLCLVVICQPGTLVNSTGHSQKCQPGWCIQSFGPHHPPNTPMLYPSISFADTPPPQKKEFY